MAEYRLTYFNSKGVAETTRMLFKLAGKEFTDRRVERGEEWDKLKPTMPKGELPVLEVDGKMMCESFAIARFVAREFNLYGADNWESATCDMVLDTVTGVFQAMLALRYKANTEEEKAEAMKKVLSSIEALDKFVASLKKGTFLLGENPTIADVAIFRIMELSELFPGFDSSLYETLKGMSKSFSELPAIAEWIKIRPETPM